MDGEIKRNPHTVIRRTIAGIPATAIRILILEIRGLPGKAIRAVPGRMVHQIQEVRVIAVAEAAAEVHLQEVPAVVPVRVQDLQAAVIN